ncbi:MAG: hypothetical protein ACK5UY_03815 [Holosporales bacterium]
MNSTKEPPSQDGTDGRKKNHVILNDQYVVHMGDIIPQFMHDLSFGQVFAFKATDLLNEERLMVAFMADKLMSPRYDMIEQLKKTSDTIIIHPEAYEKKTLGAGFGSLLFVITPLPGSSVFPDNGKQKITPWTELDVRERFIRPIINTFAELDKNSLFYRALSPSNIFYTDHTKTSIVLGECFMGHPGWRIPFTVEPIEMMLVEPAYKKNTTSFQEDIYNLGLLSLHLLEGGNPVENLTLDSLLLKKTTNGTVATFIGDKRFSKETMDFLKGCLHDNPNNRWTINDILQWLGGQTIVPKVPTFAKKAGRALVFNNTNYINLPSLVYALGKTKDGGAVKILQDNKINIWLRRSLESDDTANSLHEIFAVATRTNQPLNVTSAKALIALYPEAPLFYQGVAVDVDGLGGLFLTGLYDNQKRQFCVDIIRYGLASAWLRAQNIVSEEQSRLDKILELLKGVITNQGLGYGFERCIYELNTRVPCLSPLVENTIVLEIEDILMALEATLSKTAHQNYKNSVIDRHLAAFIASRCKFLKEEYFHRLNDKSQPWISHVALLRIFHLINQKYGNKSFPKITNWFSNTLKQNLDYFNSEPRRARISKSLEQVAESGSFSKILDIIDSPQERQKDSIEFKNARNEYVRLDNRILLHRHALRDMNALVALKTARFSPIVALFFAIFFFVLRM